VVARRQEEGVTPDEFADGFLLLEGFDGFFDRAVVFFGQAGGRQFGDEPARLQVHRFKFLHSHVKQRHQTLRIRSKSVKFIENLAFLVANNRLRQIGAAFLPNKRRFFREVNRILLCLSNRHFLRGRLLSLGRHHI